MRRLLTAITVLATTGLLLSSSGCVRCHEFVPGTKVVRAPGGGFEARPQTGGAETRPSN